MILASSHLISVLHNPDSTTGTARRCLNVYPESQLTTIGRASRAISSEHAFATSPAWRRIPWTVLLIACMLVAMLMTVGLPRTTLILGLILQALFIAFFVRHLLFVTASADQLTAADTTLAADSALPAVSVLVSCRNEQSVAAELV